MNNDKLTITFLTSTKSGILASIMFKGRKLGITCCNNHSEKLDENCSRWVIDFNGVLDCTQKKLIDEMESHPEIHLVENVVINSTKNNPTLPKETKANNIGSINLKAFDSITPQSLSIAEDKLYPLLGPITPLLIQSATSKTKHIGDLYLLLSKEIEEHERIKFLSLVDGLHNN